MRSPAYVKMAGSLVILLLWAAAGQIWAGENFESNSVAYLGPEPGQHALIVPAPSAPTTETSNREWFGGGLPWGQWSRLTGDWGQVRPTLETNGLNLAARYTMDTSILSVGGSGQRGIASGLLDLNLTFDPAPLLGVEGGTFFAQYYNRQGPNGSEHVGDMQGYDNINAGRLNQAEEIWYEQKLFQGHLRAKIGQVDANAEFDQVSAAAEFINSSAGYSPTLLDFPTYPNPALSFNLFAYPVKWFYCGAGVYTDNLRMLSNYRFEHPYLIGEVGLTGNGWGRLGPGRLAAGFWHDTGKVDRFDGDQDDGVSGFYLLAEQQIWKRSSADGDDQRGASVFVQYGHANPADSPFEHQVGLGISATGLLAGRNDDATGVYWTWTGLSLVAEAGFARNESSLEFFYKYQVTPFFALKPDLQWIRHPGGQSLPESAWVITVRAVVDF